MGRPRTQKRRPRRLWLMLPALLMNSELSKSMLALKKRLNAHLSLKLMSLSSAWLKLMRLLPRVDVQQWLNSSLASGSWKLSLAAAKAKLVILSRDSRRLSVVSRSFNSNKMKITRIKIVCPNSLASFNKRSRPTRSNLRKPRSAPKWLEMLSPLLVQLPLVCKLNEIKDFAPLSSSSKHQRLHKQFPEKTRSKAVPRDAVDFVGQLINKHKQLQGLNLQNCPIEHHVMNCTFLPCLNMKYTACKL